MTPPRTIYSGPTAENLDRIPAELKTRLQWVLWRGEDRIDPQTGDVKLNKIPIDPQTLRNADTTDPTTWGSFEQCVAALPVALEEWEHDDPSGYRGGGIGFVFSSADPYTGADFDRCVDAHTGAIAPWAQAHIEALASYTEVTPSRTGLHTLGQGALPSKGRKKGPVEMYSTGRFFTMTGWHVAGTPRTITAHQEALYEVHGRVFGPQAITLADGTIGAYCPTCDYLATLMPHGVCPSCSTPPLGAPAVTTGPTPTPTTILDDTALLEKARAAKNGTKFTALWSGDTTEHSSPSEADLALCILLAFWAQDAAQIDRLFRQSGLMRAKWGETRGAQTYGERTIAEALARQTEHYTPHEDAQMNDQQKRVWRATHWRAHARAQHRPLPTMTIEETARWR
jgi:primase-polymerase (primpol)-like protein